MIMTESISSVLRIYASFDKEKFELLKFLNSNKSTAYEKYLDDIYEKYGYHLGISADTQEELTAVPIKYNYPFGLLHKLIQIGRINSTSYFDTVKNPQYFLISFVEKGTEFLSNIEGSFACYYIGYLTNKERHYIFRNELTQIYFSDIDMSISSTRFEGSYSLEPNVIIMLNFEEKRFMKTKLTFQTRDNPYDF